MAGCSSTSSFPTTTSVRSSARAAMVGARARQGGHQVAQKSTTATRSAARACASKFSAVKVTTFEDISPPMGSERQPPEAERVEDDGHGTEGHGRAGQHRAQEDPEERIEDPGRYGHAERVVDEREEQVLTDVAHGAPAEAPRAHDPAQV